LLGAPLNKSADKNIMSLLEKIFTKPDMHPQHQNQSLVSVGSDILLVTIGDSWTFGGSMKFLLPDSATSQDLSEFRKNNIFGAFLAKKLNADWINAAYPSMSNQWIADQFVKLCSIRHQLEYKKIYVVITLTEVGRELEDGFLDLKQFTSINALIQSLSQLVLNKIISSMHTDITVILGRNYADNSYQSPLMLPKSWLDVIREADNDLQPFVRSSFMLIDPIAKLHQNFNKLSMPRETFLMEMDEIFKGSQERIDALSRSNFNIHKQGYQHPNVEGHKVWADYIYKEIVCS